ncbi:hypothetical protein ACFRAE_14750 [Sphingobacterium sp. HJSM2_6]|uniref:hypothetical protein n=1 Tax=Sphingobacterium sp. HJSM2_6 TaxID=3366264 RepID=UPI003BC01515
MKQQKKSKHTPPEPNKSFLNHTQLQASTMAELLGEAKGEQYIKETLLPWPRLIATELSIFSKRKKS